MKYYFLIFSTLLFTSTMNAQTKNDKTVNVNANAQTKVNPDEVIFRISVKKKADSFEKAMNELDREIVNAKNTLKKQKLDPDMIRTSQYNVEKNYFWNKGKRHEDGYVGTSTVEARNKLDSKFINNVLKKFGGHSPDLSINVDFVVSDKLVEKTKNELLEKAILRAKSKVMAICKALGKNLVDIKHVSYNEGGYAQPVYKRNYAEARTMAADAFNDQAIENVQEIKFNLSVSTEWVID